MALRGPSAPCTATGSHGVEVCHPGGEFCFVPYVEREVIQASAQGTEPVAGTVVVVVEAHKEAAVRMEQQGAWDTRLAGRDLELLNESEAEDALIPVRACVHVPNG